MGFIIVAVALLGADLDAASIARLEGLVPHASGLCLAEVVDLKEIDARPMDGNLSICATLREIRGSGKRQHAISIIKEWGGYPNPRSKAPEIKLKLQPDSLTKGQEYWFVFCSPYMQRVEGIIDYWPKGTPEVDELLTSAVSADYYCWQPQYHPESGITYGHLAISEQKGWRLRAQKEGKTLWEKTLPGIPSPFLMTEGIGVLDRGSNPSRWFAPVAQRFELWAETETMLSDRNDYQLPSVKYHFQEQFDLETGKHVAASILDGKTGATPIVFQVYDEKTGRRRGEERYEYIKIGGRFFDADTDGWVIKVEQTYDPVSGDLMSEELYRAGTIVHPGSLIRSSAWIPMGKRVLKTAPP
jgi:hypothetical protein